METDYEVRAVVSEYRQARGIHPVLDISVHRSSVEWSLSYETRYRRYCRFHWHGPYADWDVRIRFVRHQKLLTDAETVKHALSRALPCHVWYCRHNRPYGEGYRKLAYATDGMTVGQILQLCERLDADPSDEITQVELPW